MQYLATLVVVLDILVAAFVATLLTRFWTGDHVEESVRELREHHRTWAWGATLLIPGILLNVPATLSAGMDNALWTDLLMLAGYPFFMAGIYLMYDSTHPGDPDDGPATEVGA